jgi:hypothetical protein
MNWNHWPLCLGLVLTLSDAAAAEPLRGYNKRVTVSAATRPDWTFAVSNRSLATPPADWLPADYDSPQQAYELYVPPTYNAKQSYPLLVFISPGAEPLGWKHWETVCKQHGIIFAGAYGAGNDCPGKQRVRIVLDVLDDVRRRVKIDPDRTYLAGFSGGGRIACAIAFALPEFFGGVAPICAGGDLREEPWLRHRLIDRLSVAYVTGEGDFNRGEVERYRGPMFKVIGVRTRVWVVPKMGHSVPSGAPLLEAYRWLEGGLKQRQELATKYPASRWSGSDPPSRAAWSQALLKEARQRLKVPGTLYAGLMQLQGIMHRWEDLPAAAEAKKILLEYDAREDRPWEKDDLAEQRRFLYAQARALDAYASGPLPEQYLKLRSKMVEQAIQLWEQILQDGPDTKPGQEAKKRLPVLRKLADEHEGK